MVDKKLPDGFFEGVGSPVSAADASPKTIETRPFCACVDALRRVEAFADLPAEQLEWFIANADELRFEPGEIVFKKGDPPDWMLVYLEGEVQARWDENNLDDFVYIVRAGDPQTEISGKLPFSRMKELEINGRAVVKTRILRFPAALFPELIRRMPTLAERLVWIMMDRVRESTRIDERRDKLMALGKLSAGLAHELNNPASAARRTSDELVEIFDELRVAELNVCRRELSVGQRQMLSDFERGAIDGDAPANLTSLERSDREEEIVTWLDHNGVEESWRLAPVLAETNLSTDDLEAVRRELPSEALHDAFRRAVLQISASKAAKEIKTSVTRISELVGAIKEYSYMDQAAVQSIDLHRGLDNTLLILKYKLKKKNVEVVREFDERLPKITAHGSMLNQVWTNLIDNAIDAMPETGGRLKVRTRLELANILVEIRDNGSGIDPEHRPHIFEPFYTTKAVSEGTGLGLDMVARIVRKHRGDIRFQTKPGDTCFEVRLPLDAETNA